MKKIRIYTPKLLIVTMISLIVIMTATTVMELYYYNNVMAYRDVDRERFCDISFKGNLDGRDIVDIDKCLRENVQDYLISMYMLHEESGFCILGYFDTNLSVTDAYVYGAKPYVVMEYRKICPQDLNGIQINTVIVECTKKITYNTITTIKNTMKEIGLKCNISHKTRLGWLFENINYYKYIVLMSFFVLVFSISSIFLIEKYVVDQSRKILVVCLMCGADNKWLKKYCMRGYVVRQFISLIISNLIAYVFVYVFNILDIDTFYILPLFLSAIIFVFCYVIYRIILKSVIDKNIIKMWRHS